MYRLGLLNVRRGGESPSYPPIKRPCVCVGGGPGFSEVPALIVYCRLSILNTDFAFYPKRYCFFCFFFDGLSVACSSLFSFWADVCPISLFQDEGLPRPCDGRFPQSLFCCQSEFSPRPFFPRHLFRLCLSGPFVHRSSFPRRLSDSFVYPSCASRPHCSARML